MAAKKRMIEWTKLGDVKLKKFLFWGAVDPTDELQIRVRDYMSEEKKKHNQIVANTFDLDEDEFTKYEFMWISPAEACEHDPNNHVFKMDVDASVIYIKPKSFLLFRTEYKIRIKKGCLPMNGTVLAQGGKNYDLEEIFYSKVNSIQATHEERLYHIVKGCFGGHAPYTEVVDGLKIRTFENFQILDDDPNELQACRRDLNSRVQEFN